MDSKHPGTAGEVKIGRLSAFSTCLCCSLTRGRVPRAAEQGLQSFPKQLVPILSGEIVGGDSSAK